MNNPSPLVPQGSLLEQQKSKGKSNLFIAVFTILAINLVLFGGLLMQGCRPKKPADVSALDATNGSPVEVGNIQTNPIPLNPVLPMPGSGSNAVAEIPTNTAPPPIPGNVAPAPAAPTEAGGTTKDYTVVRGDSFFKIAKAHGISMHALTSANPAVDARKPIKAGQVLQIPTAAAVSPAPGGTETTGTETAASTYAVKAGDTLTKIAKAHGTTPKEIRAANNLKTDRLHVGQQLKLPAPKTGGSNTPAATSPQGSGQI